MIILCLLFQVAAINLQGETVPENQANTTESAPANHEEEKVDSASLSLMRKLTRTHLIQSKNEVEITRNDPKSPLHSIKSFEELRM